MSTRSRIGLVTKDQDGNPLIISVYCHNDGYPSGVGSDLHKRFPNGTPEEEIKSFIEEGDRSTVDTSYFEWRGETPEWTEHSSLEEFLEDAEESFAEYVYIYENGVWKSGGILTYGIELETEFPK